MTLTIGKNLVYSLQFTVYSKKATQRRKSFTLMEMLVVLAVIAMILGISIPFFSSFTKGANVKTAARDISAVLNTARNLAITYRQDYSVIFDADAQPQSYYIVDQEEKIYGKKYSLPSSVKLAHPANPGLPTTFPLHKATFSSTGGLKGSSGSVWISDRKDDFRRIAVSNTTGRVKVDKQP